jgi:hypothetical protein
VSTSGGTRTLDPPGKSRLSLPLSYRRVEEGEGVEPSGVTLARFSRPVARHRAPPSKVGTAGLNRQPLRPERSALTRLRHVPLTYP